MAAGAGLESRKALILLEGVAAFAFRYSPSPGSGFALATLSPPGRGAPSSAPARLSPPP